MAMLRSILSITFVALAMTLGAGNLEAAEGENSLGPNPAKAFKGDKCVEPVDDMRRYHMNYLKHQRDETVIDGVRGNKYSLNQCIDCHATKSPSVAGGNIRTIEPFCAECHAFAAVKIDCFECHTGAAGQSIKKKQSMPKEHGKSDFEKNALVVGMLDNFMKSKSNVVEGAK